MIIKDSKGKEYFYEVMEGVNVEICPKRGEEPYLRKECELEPIMFLSSYIKSSCPYNNFELKISGLREFEILKQALEWAIKLSKIAIEEQKIKQLKEEVEKLNFGGQK